MPLCNRCRVEVEDPVGHVLGVHLDDWLQLYSANQWPWMDATFDRGETREINWVRLIAVNERIAQAQRALEGPFYSLAPRSATEGTATEGPPQGMEATQQVIQELEQSYLVFLGEAQALFEQITRQWVQQRIRIRQQVPYTDPVDWGQVERTLVGRFLRVSPEVLRLQEVEPDQGPEVEAILSLETEIFAQLSRAMEVEWSLLRRVISARADSQYAAWLEEQPQRDHGMFRPETERVRERLHSEARARVEGALRRWIRQQISERSAIVDSSVNWLRIGTRLELRLHGLPWSSWTVPEAAPRQASRNVDQPGLIAEVSMGTRVAELRRRGVASNGVPTNEVNLFGSLFSTETQHQMDAEIAAITELNVQLRKAETMANVTPAAPEPASRTAWDRLLDDD